MLLYCVVQRLLVMKTVAKPSIKQIILLVSVIVIYYCVTVTQSTVVQIVDWLTTLAAEYGWSMLQ